MGKNTKISTIWVNTPDAQGTWANVTTPLAEANINIWGFNAWTWGNNKAQFVLWTDDNAKALSVLKKAGWNCKEEQAVACEWNNKAGEMASIAKKAGKAGVNMTWLWTVPGSDSKTAQVIASATDVDALWKALA